MLNLSFLLTPQVDSQRVLESDAVSNRSDDCRRGLDVMVSKERVNAKSVPFMVLDILADSIPGIPACPVVNIDIIRELRLEHDSQTVLSIPLN